MENITVSSMRSTVQPSSMGWLEARVVSTEDSTRFQLCFQGVVILSFEWPPMDSTELRKMIAGQDAQDQNYDQNYDNFSVRTRNGELEVEIVTSEESGPMVLNLPLALCKPALEQLLPSYLKYEAESDADNNREEIDQRLVGVVGPCQCGRDGCDDCRALKETQDFEAYDRVEKLVGYSGVCDCDKPDCDDCRLTKEGHAVIAKCPCRMGRTICDTCDVILIAEDARAAAAMAPNVVAERMNEAWIKAKTDGLVSNLPPSTNEGLANEEDFSPPKVVHKSEPGDRFKEIYGFDRPGPDVPPHVPDDEETYGCAAYGSFGQKLSLTTERSRWEYVQGNFDYVWGRYEAYRRAGASLLALYVIEDDGLCERPTQLIDSISFSGERSFRYGLEGSFKDCHAYVRKFVTRGSIGFEPVSPVMFRKP